MKTYSVMYLITHDSLILIHLKQKDVLLR
jgi:hypothetical protein